MQPSRIRRRAFVLRVWQDESGRIWGQITEPVSEWRRPFAGLEELWDILLDSLDIPGRGKGGRDNE
jgi:hypothetical protein